MGERRERVPLRHSLVVRLFVVLTAVAVAAVAATAWLTVGVTTAGLREERGDAVAASVRIEDALVRHAATHRDWSEVGPLVDRLAESTGNRITLTDDTGTVLADSSPGLALPDGQPTTIDPLDVPAAPAAAEPTDPTEPTEPTEPREPLQDSCSAQARAPTPCPAAGDELVGPPPAGAPISPDAVGPFALTSTERRTSAALAERAATCLAGRGDDVTVALTASGRSTVDLSEAAGITTAECDTRALLRPFASEREPLRRVQTLTRRCLERRDGPVVTLLPDLGWIQEVPRTAAADRVVVACLTEARRSVLRPWVAPPVRLSVSSTRQEPTTFLDLSSGNRWRIGGFAALVLLGAIGVAAVAGRRVVRPLGELASAAGRVREGDLSARADVRGSDEIGRVAAAFNTMAERREEAEQLRKAMVGDVAHELRNPISTIRGTLEAAQDGLVAVDTALLASLLEETLLLQHVVEDLRDLAAADAGELRLTRTAVDAADLLAQVAAGHDAVEVIHVDDGLVVDGDPLRLRQVLGNLVSNAVRHSHGGGRVELGARVVGPDVEISVRDHGEGIAEADLPHVFERFWRADPSRTRSSGGSGLGLAIVRQLVEAHGGSVEVESVLGEGARFVVRLPS